MNVYLNLTHANDLSHHGYIQSLVKITFGNFTPSFHFSVQLPNISFFTHLECKSLELERTIIFQGKIVAKTQKTKKTSTRSLSKMAPKKSKSFWYRKYVLNTFIWSSTKSYYTNTGSSQINHHLSQPIHLGTQPKTTTGTYKGWLSNIICKYLLYFA